MGRLFYGGKTMTPQMSADLHAMGLLSLDEALWVYRDGRISANLAAMIKDGEPVF